MLIEVKDVSKRYGEQSVLEQVRFSVARGESFGIIGPNGSGKSTLIKLLSGIEPPSAGEVVLDGKPVGSHSRKSLSKWVSVLQQEALPAVGFTVREVVEMGRFPHQNWLGEEPSAEAAERLIDEILERLSLDALGERSLERLSGGERQRVALGKTMAQQPLLLMLDEPTTYLDIGHQVMLMERIREWQAASGMTVIAVLHDLNLASLYCDRLLMLHDGRVAGIGTPSELLQESLIRDVYGITPMLVEHPTRGVPQLILPFGG